MVGEARVHLHQLQAYTNGDERQRVRARRPGPHRPGQLPFRLLPVTTMDGKPSRRGKGQHAKGIVVQPVITDRPECQPQMFRRLTPMPVVHGQHGTLGLAQDKARDIYLSGCGGGSLFEQG
jgi:hypothetical protein